MTERPQLSVVDGGKGAREPGGEATQAPASLEARLMAELRAQREQNADLTLEAGASCAAVALAARRQEDLLVQLQLEREARRQVEAQLRERDAALRQLADQLGVAGQVIEAAQTNGLALAAEAEAANARNAGLQERLDHVEAHLTEAVDRLSQFKAYVRERDAQLIAVRAELNDQAGQAHELGKRLARVQAKREAAAVSAQAANAASAEMAGLIRAFMADVSHVLGGDLQPEDLSAAGFSGIVERISRLHAEYLDAQSAVAALVTEKAAMSAELADVAAKHAEMSGKAENRYHRLNRQATEIAALRDAVVRGEQVASGLQASLKERDASMSAQKKENARLQADLAGLKARASQLEQQNARAEADLAAAVARHSKQKTELQGELTRIGEVSSLLAQRVETAERDNNQLRQVEAVLRAELSDLNTLLEERRTLIRQLQQERALVKLGRKRPSRET